MKILLILSLLVLVSCSCESDDHKERREKARKEEEMLSHAEKKQEETVDTNIVTELTITEPAQPTCNKVSFNEIRIDGKFIATCLSNEVEVKECGVIANMCDDKKTYACMHNVEITFIEREVCEK